MLHTDPNTPIYGYYATEDDPSRPNTGWTELGTLSHVPSLQYGDTLQARDNRPNIVELIHENQDTGELTFTDYEVTIL